MVQYYEWIPFFENIEGFYSIDNQLAMFTYSQKRESTHNTVPFVSYLLLFFLILPTKLVISYHLARVCVLIDQLSKLSC